MNDANFTENSYEQAIIALFEQMGYRYEANDFRIVNQWTMGQW